MKKLKLFFACLLMAVLSIGQVWAAEQVAYTLTPAAGSNNSYTGNCDVAISGITWNVTGNASLVPWRLGGKSSNCTNADREVYSKTAMSDAITKVELTVGAASSITVNSLTLIVASDADFNTQIDAVAGTFAANSTITFQPTSPLTEWTATDGVYFKFVFNLSVSGTSNKFVAFSEAKFYKEVSSVTCADPTFSPAAGTFYGSQEITLATETTGASIYYTLDGTTPSSSNGTLYEDPFTITETKTVKAIAVKDGATDSGVAEATYTAGAAVTSYVIDFETNNLAAYVNWDFVNIKCATTTIAAHAGTYYGNTDGKASASITTKAKIATPGALTFWTSKESGNTTASSWIAQVSDDGDTWTDAGTFDATTGAKGEWTERTADLSAYADVYVRVAYSGSTAVRAIDDISLSTTPSLLKPTITGVENFVNTTEVTISHATADAIYYTTNGDVPTTGSTLYSAPFELNATATVKAIAVKGGESSPVAEKEFTKIVPWTVAEANEQLGISTPQNGKYVRGIISQIDNYSSNAITYWISDDGSTTGQLEVYKGKNLNNTNFSAITDLALGDVVVVYGNLKVFTPSGGGSINEFDAGNYLVSKEAPAVAAPVFSPDGGGFMGETDVTITCETAGSAIYYTLDGTTPSKSSSAYSAAIHLDATTTIKAIAYVGDDASLVVTKTFTLSAPMTVAEALAALDTESPINNAAVSGIISTAPAANPSSGRLTYYISDDGTDTDELEVYLGYGLNGASFSNKTDLQVGDEVTVFGNLTIHNSTTKEFAAGSRLLAFNRPAVPVTGIDLTESTASVEVGSTVTLHASVVPGNATDQGIVWSVTSGSDKASVDENGVVTGTAAGEAVIRAASHEDASIYEECTVTVTAVDPTKHTVTFIAGTDQSDETSITKDGITISASTFNNASYYQCYSGAAMTVSSTVGNITKIELTCTASGTAKYGPGNWNFTGYSYDGTNGLWAGSAETVEFGNASQQVRMTLITVTYKEDNRDAAGLAWNPAGDIELTVGDALTAPALLNPNSIDAAEITIESSNTDLATVSEGVVSLVADATGTTTITATFAGNDDYKPATISYNITVNEAGLDNVTFDSSEDHAESGETTITKGGFTLSFTSGSMDGTQAEYRLYKSQTMTLSSTDYLIKKIEFTCTSGNPITGFADATGLDKDNNEWTGESNTVELTASNAQVRMTKIKVFYVEDTRAAAGLAWDPADDIELTVGDALSAPALQNPNNIAENLISITSSNTDLATVTAGEVALVADATGTTTITATFAGNDDFKPATVSYKITVNPAHSIYVSPSLNVNFGNVDQDAEVADKTITVTLTGVDAATLNLAGDGASAFTISPAAALTASGDITISASSANLGTFAATLTISDDASQAESKVVHLSLTVNEVVVPETPVSTTSKWVAATEIVDGMQVLIVGVNGDDVYAMGAQTNNNRTAVKGSVDGEGVFTPGENTMAFTLVAQGDGTYAIMSSNDKYLYAAASGSNYLRTQADVDDNAKWTLSLTSAVAESSSNRNVMQFNSGSSIFSCYASASQKSIALYVPQTTPATPDYTRDVTNGHYGTICLPNGGTISGATLFDLDYYDGANTLYLLEVNGNAMVAGRPYIFLPSATTTIEVFYTGEENAPAGTYRGLVGSYTKALVEANVGNYILLNNQYWYVNSEAYVGVNRAYIDMNYVADEPMQQQAGAPRRRVAMAVNGKDAAQGFENLDASEKPMKVMIEGTLYILRGEKVYDATGRLVK